VNLKDETLWHQGSLRHIHRLMRINTPLMK